MKSLIVQAEDDDGDMGEMVDSMMKGLDIPPGSDEVTIPANNVKIVMCNDATKDKFIEKLRMFLEEFPPDIVWINPILVFLGGDTNKQTDVGGMLRNGINPLLTKYKLRSFCYSPYR